MAFTVSQYAAKLKEMYATFDGELVAESAVAPVDPAADQGDATKIKYATVGDVLKAISAKDEKIMTVEKLQEVWAKVREEKGSLNCPHVAPDKITIGGLPGPGVQSLMKMWELGKKEPIFVPVAGPPVSMTGKLVASEIEPAPAAFTSSDTKPGAVGVSVPAGGSLTAQWSSMLGESPVWKTQAVYPAPPPSTYLEHFNPYSSWPFKKSTQEEYYFDSEGGQATPRYSPEVRGLLDRIGEAYRRQFGKALPECSWGRDPEYDSRTHCRWGRVGWNKPGSRLRLWLERSIEYVARHRLRVIDIGDDKVTVEWTSPEIPDLALRGIADYFGDAAEKARGLVEVSGIRNESRRRRLTL